MGFYINTPGMPALGKTDHLLYDYPETFSEVSLMEASNAMDDPQLGVVIIVENIEMKFEAAAFAFSKDEFKVFTDSSDLRPKRYLTGPREALEVMSGYA